MLTCFLFQDYMSFQNSHVKSSQLQIPNPEAEVEMYLDPPVDEIVAAHIRLCS